MRDCVLRVYALVLHYVNYIVVAQFGSLFKCAYKKMTECDSIAKNESELGALYMV